MPMTTATHNVWKAHRPKVHGNDYCQKLTLVDGELIRCMEPTKGHTYCQPCSMHLITLTDRKAPAPASLPAAKGHPWAEESFDLAMRKKRKAQAA